MADRKLAQIVLVAALSVLGTVFAAGCGTVPTDAPTISVVTSIYPLAQAVSAIGGSTVAVTDLATAGVDPRTMSLTPAQVARVHRAAVVIDVGEGFQPAVENAASGSARVVSLAPRFGPPGNGAWLDPTTMTRMLPVITAALSAANPKATSSYNNGERDFYEQVSSTGNDFQDALSACPKNQIAAPDAALSTVASDYHLHLHQLGTSPSPTPAVVAKGAVAVARAGITTVFSEPWVATATVKAVAGQSGAKVRAFDTLEAPPAGGWPKDSTYITLMENNLQTLTSAFGCPDTTDSQD